MKEVSFNFSLTDFLAYLFPGTVTLIAVAGIVRLTPYEHLLFEIKPDIFIGLILVALAYAVGVIISSLIINDEEELAKYNNNKELSEFNDDTKSLVLNEIYPKDFKKEIEEAFNKIFGEKEKWTAQHFYIIRSLVREKMPACSIAFERQSSLRQFRRNSIIPILLLGAVGYFAGIKGVYSFTSKGYSGVSANDYFALVCCISLSLFSVVGTWKIFNSLNEGISRSRRREVREVYTGLLAFHKYNNLAASEDFKRKPTN